MRSPLLVLAAGVFMVCQPARASLGETGAAADRLRTAKTLFFDRNYGEARQIWQEILGTSRGADADAAAYWIARCSENMGEAERAFGEYGAFLARRPPDQALAEEARTSRVGLAAKLHKAGKTEHLRVLTEALQDPSKTVRYYAALQMASLGPTAGGKAVPVLRRIIAEEKDEDLVERAKLGLLRLDPQSLAQISSPLEVRGRRWLKVRIFDKGRRDPTVSINLPLALAEALFKSLPDPARRELGKRGYDADNFFERLDRLAGQAPGASIIDIQGDDGGKIQIWIE